MNCPHYKNPTQNNTAECEWCGAGFSIIPKDYEKNNSKSPSIAIIFAWLFMFMGVLLASIAFYRIQIVHNYDSTDLYLGALFFPLGLFIKMISKNEK